MKDIYQRLGLKGPLGDSINKWPKGKTKHAIPKNNFSLTQMKYNGNI